VAHAALRSNLYGSRHAERRRHGIGHFLATTVVTGILPSAWNLYRLTCLLPDVTYTTTTWRYHTHLLPLRMPADNYANLTSLPPATC